jgi:hypothetical protein
MKLATIVLAGVATAAAGTVALAAKPSPLGPPPPAGTRLAPGECIPHHDLRNHSVVDKKTMLFDVRGKSLYRFTMRNACLTSAISADPIGMRLTGSSSICKPSDVDITARSGICIVDSIVKLTPEEVASLPRKLKP